MFNKGGKKISLLPNNSNLKFSNIILSLSDYFTFFCSRKFFFLLFILFKWMNGMITTFAIVIFSRNNKLILYKFLICSLFANEIKHYNYSKIKVKNASDEINIH